MEKLLLISIAFVASSCGENFGGSFEKDHSPMIEKGRKVAYQPLGNFGFSLTSKLPDGYVAMKSELGAEHIGWVAFDTDAN